MSLLVAACALATASRVASRSRDYDGERERVVTTITARPPVVALNASTPGTRAYFPATLSWAGQTLLLGVNTQSDNLHDKGMRGRTVASVDGGTDWQEIVQQLAPWQLEDCCLPVSKREYLSFSYDLRRQTTNDSSRAFVHAVVLQLAGAGPADTAAPVVVKQVAVRNVSFHFSDPLLQPAVHRAIGCPQSPDSLCNKTSNLALPTETFAFQNTGNLVAAAHPHSSKRLFTSIYGVYDKVSSTKCSSTPPCTKVRL